MSNHLDQPPTSVRDWGLSWIRTTVPILWGYGLTFLVTRLPDVYVLLAQPQVQAAVVVAVAAAWYALMRWIEPHLPAWLTAFVLGANAAPRYPVADRRVGSVVDVPEQKRLGDSL